jgi:spore photoproduct lyase
MKSADRPLRIGTGQFSDSLALDKKTGFSRRLIELFADQDKHLLELKTKSSEVDHLLDVKHNGKTVFAWSVNPQKIVKSDEAGSVSLSERIKAAKKCVDAGYPVAFHFDPIIRCDGWEKDYKGVVDLIFSKIDPENIAWISLGALRYHPDHKNIFEDRFSQSKITFDKLEMGEDGKMRYSKPLRIDIFRKMQEFIRSHSKNIIIYLCMESQDIWDQSGIIVREQNPYHRYFKFFKTK